MSLQTVCRLCFFVCSVFNPDRCLVVPLSFLHFPCLSVCSAVSLSLSVSVSISLSLFVSVCLSLSLSLCLSMLLLLLLLFLLLLHV